MNPKNHARTRDADQESAWKLEPHCCRLCFGRVASRRDDDERIYQCTNCGTQAVGMKPAAICACGIKIKKSRGDGRSSMVLVDAGIRCHENKSKSPEFPSLYVASYGGAQPESDS